ncbi:MAG: T9SS type A sorting domain-containing protein, partial [Bacteroidota bacterium]
LIGWKNYANVPSGITLGAAGLEYGTSATSSRNNLVNVKSWTITGDMAGTGACLPCPVFTAAPADVTIVNSSCSTGCTLASGTITAPSNTGSNKGNVTPGSPCPAGSSIEYQVNGGAWTTTLPVYDQDGPAQTVKTRCTCDSDNTMMSAESAGVTTVPGVCTPPAPSISGDSGVCPAESAMLTVTGTGTYTWSNSLGSNATVNVTPPSTTTYTVTATDSNGCTGTATATVTVYQSPVPGITDVENSGSANDDGIICVGAGVNVSGSGGVDYAWSEGQTTSSFFIRPYCTTSYELTVTDANGCTATAGTTVFVNYTPEIQTVSPTSGSAGTTVTITGTHLSDVTDVTFNGVAGTNVNVISSTEVRANLPSSGTLSDVTVVSPCGEVNIDVAAPVINSFSPGAGPVGTLITVLGDHLDNLTSVTVGGVSAAVVSNNGNTLVIAVMPGSTTGSISLNSGGGSTGTQGSFTVTSTPYPYFQQGGKRVGTNSSSTAQQATSLAISTDGSTVVIGAPGDNSNTGAAWVFTKDGSNWVQLGGKLVGTGAVGQSRQGASVAIGLEGNTIALGAPGDNSNAGAVWIFTRNGSSWTQQGEKLVGSGAAGAAQQGTSVALSGDGNTVAFGGISDDFYNGAAWAFVRTDGVWAQQGSKMVSSGAIGRARQGASVALSADGNTMIVGAYQDDNRKGAVWIYTRTDCEWMQAGAKLVGTGGTSQAWQGYSVALSADGNTAVAGASADNSLIGATWVFTRSGGSWTQQGNRLVGTHSTSTARQGSSVALSADGNTAITGGLNDDSGKGAMWVFTRNSTTWSQQGSKLKGTSAVGASKQGTAVAVNAIGTTALIGGPADNGSKGAFWVYSLGSIPSVKKEITEDRNNEQAAFVLGQSVPNPSTGQFTIGFDVPEGCIAEWIFSDMNGRAVLSLKREYPAGANQESFDLQGNTGVYFYQLKTPAGIKTGKLTIVGY